MALTKVIGAGLGATQEGAITFNEGSADVDFRVETNGNANTLFVDGGNNNVGIGTASPAAAAKLQIDGGRCYISANSDAFALYLRYNVDTAGVLLGSPATDEFTLCRSGGQTHLKIDATGAVTKPLQPAFMARPASTQSNLSSGTVIVFGNEVFDNNADFASNVFTAPVAGRYQLMFQGRADNTDQAAAYSRFYLKTSNRNYESIFHIGGLSGDASYWTFVICVLADMDASDTAFVEYNQGGGSNQADMQTAESTFSGYLVA
tara:strand:- start:18 stop:803 length:786 start_codon:yes stop_codon:yes gene_type:complete